MNTREYLAAVKAKHNIVSDYALAKLLHVSRHRVSEWQAGKGAMGPLMCFKVAELLGEQPAAVVAEIELERAEAAAKEEDADAWKKVIRRMGGTAATILVALGVGGISNADAKLAQPSQAEHLYIVSSINDVIPTKLQCAVGPASCSSRYHHRP